MSRFASRDQRRREDERGLLSTELAIVMPIIFLIGMLAIFASQVGRHDSRAQQAADAGARAASYFTNDPAAAQAAALTAAGQVCLGTVVIDDFDWQPPEVDSLTPGYVGVTLTCTENPSDVTPLFTMPERSVPARAVATIEYWRPES